MNMLHILVSSCCVKGPDNEGVEVPGSDGVEGPGSDCVEGPGCDGVEGPGRDGIEGPGSDGVEGPGNNDVSLVDGGVHGDNISSFTMISFTFGSIERESTYSPIKLPGN